MEKRQRNQRGDGARLRLEVLAAAMRVLDRRPATELSLRTVAREAGVAPPSIYAHFPDAVTMTAEIVRECWRQLGDEIARDAPVAPTTPVATLQAQIGAYVRYAMERPFRYQLLFASPAMDTEENGVPNPLQAAYCQTMSAIERFAAEGGILLTGDAYSAAIMTLSLAHGRIALAHLAPLRPANSTAQVQAFVLELIGRIFGA